MPSKERRLKALTISKIDQELSNAPPHIKSKLGLPNSTSQLAMNIASGLKEYDFRGNKYDSDGNLVAIPNRGRAGGHVHAAAADERCRELRKEHSDIWGNRGKAHVIAKKANISRRTVIRYFTRCP